MIASVSGELRARRPDHVVIEAAGVGYRLTVSGETLRSMPSVGSPASLLSEMVVREDSMSLYGFATEEERNLFVQLTSVNGVGPKVAIAALSAGPARELLRAIAAGDAKRFQAVPGIGKRTAERILVELREKVAGEIEADVAESAEIAVGPRSEAREGLINLGYTPIEAEQLLDRAEGESAEELVTSALRGAAGARAA